MKKEHACGALACKASGLGRVFLAGALVSLCGWALLAPQEARAQHVCETDPATTPTATGGGSFACGSGAYAGGSGTTVVGAGAGFGSVDPANSNNSAFGYLAGTDVEGSLNTGLGTSAGQNVQGERNTATGAQAGNNVTGIFNVATGSAAGREVEGDHNTATGAQAGNFVTGNFNTTSGSNAGGNVTGSQNVATGAGSGRHVTGDRNVALGANTAEGVVGNDNFAAGTFAGMNVVGDHNIAMGENAGRSLTGSNNITSGNAAGMQMTGENNIAMGQNASRLVNGSDNVAIGARAGTNGFGLNVSRTVALGADSLAAFDDSTAIGSGVQTTRVGQVAIGTTSNTYTLAGVTSADSLAAQTGPLFLMTTDGDGNLAASNFNVPDIAGLDGRVGALEGSIASMGGRIDKAFEGTAMALAMAGGGLPSDKNYAVSINWGVFEGENAFAGTAAFRINEYVHLHGGIGVGARRGTLGGRAGMTVAW